MSSTSPADAPERSPLSRVASMGAFAVLLLLIAALAFGVVHPPLIAVSGDSMEPTFSEGDAILVSPTEPTTIEEGDIVVINVPEPVQQQYDYPPSIVHRVSAIERTSSGPAFETEGDNTGTDPFTVYPDDIRGVVSVHIPHAGYLLLYVQSWQGRVFILTSALLTGWYYYGPTVRERAAATLRETTGQVSGGTVDDELVTEIEQTNQKVRDLEQSVEALAVATDEYGTHLRSHTHAVQQMGDAAQRLQESAERQNQILAQMTDSLPDHARQTTPAESSDATRSPTFEDATLHLVPPEALVDEQSAMVDPADLFDVDSDDASNETPPAQFADDVTEGSTERSSTTRAPRNRSDAPETHVPSEGDSTEDL